VTAVARRTALASLGIAGLLAVSAHARPAQAPPAPAPPSATITLPAAVTSLAAINMSSLVAAGMADGRVAVWNGHDAAPMALLKPHDARVLAVGSTSDGRDLWSVASDGTLARTRIAAGAPSDSKRVDLGAAPTRAAAFSADGSLLVTGGEFGEIRVFETASSALKQQFRGHRTELQDLAVRPGTALVASVSAEADLRVWDASSGREMRLVDGDLSIFAVAFSPRDGTLASGGVDRRLTLRDSKTFDPAGELALRAPRMVSTLAWSADGRLVAVGDIDDETLSKGGIQLIDAESRASVASLDTGGVPAGRIAFVSGGPIVAIVDRDLRAWPVAAR
jgi:WD40 repeat protein